MAATVATFRNAFPEFEDEEDSFIQTKLDEAEQSIGRTVWGESKGDLGQIYLAAHLVHTNPTGGDSRLLPDGGGSVYGVRYKHLVREVAGGPQLGAPDIRARGV